MKNENILREFISENVKQLRIENGWSQMELSKRCGVTGAAISKIEKGVGLPSLDMSIKLAKAFNLTLDELTGLNQIDINRRHERVFFNIFGHASELGQDHQYLVLNLIDTLRESSRYVYKESNPGLAISDIAGSKISGGDFVKKWDAAIGRSGMVNNFVRDDEDEKSFE